MGSFQLQKRVMSLHASATEITLNLYCTGLSQRLELENVGNTKRPGAVQILYYSSQIVKLNFVLVARLTITATAKFTTSFVPLSALVAWHQFLHVE
jgi:hypothetical protein